MALDISKGFDRVWNAGLLHKFKSYGIVEFWRFNPDNKWDFLLISLLYFWSLNSNSQTIVYISYAVLPESSGEYNVLMQ